MNANKRMALGRGLDALLGDDANSADSSKMQQMAIDDLVPGKYQPRQQMDPVALSALADSIASQGVLQPVAVRALATGGYEILAGERRWRAAKLAGLKTVPVILHDVNDDQALIIALIENIQREDLNVMEQAIAIGRLVDEFGLTHAEAASQLGRSRSAITNLLRLLSLPEPIKTMLQSGKMEMGHARALLALDVVNQMNLAKAIVDKGLSVRQVEALVQQQLSQKTETTSKIKPAAHQADIVHLEHKISEWLGTKTALSTNNKGQGKLTIAFSSLTQLDALLTRLGVPKEE